jgi:hypothetical protein
VKSVVTALTISCFAITLSQGHAAQYINVVKKSSSGICHDVGSRWYSKLKRFKAYATIDACLAKGGRMYSGYRVTNGEGIDSEYSRDLFPHWVDDDKDCQDTRAEVLITQSSIPVVFADKSNCQVTTGAWYDPYTDKVYYDDDDLDIDHIVPLKWAYEHGADDWPLELRREFANSPMNTIAVYGSANRSKGARGPSKWMPPNHKYRCQYLKNFIAVLNEYKLVFSASEKRITDRQIASCN